MELENFKKIIALVYIKGEEKFPLTTTKTKLAEKIIENSSLKNYISTKSLVNYYSYFFDGGSNEPKPNQDTIDSLLEYINYNSQKQFIENQPTNTSYLEDVPFANKNNASTKEEEEEHSESNSTQSESQIVKDSITILVKNKSIFYNSKIVGIIALVSIVAIAGFYFFNNTQNNHSNECYYWDAERIIKLPCNSLENGIPINITNIKDVNINTFRRITPTHETQFFNAKHQPQVWYASYNNELEFFNQKGNHPISGELLHPVTPEIIQPYIVRVSERELEQKETIIKPKKENPITFNPDENSKTSKKNLKVFILDSLNQMDYTFLNHFKSELVNKYSITETSINKENIEHILAKNIDYFNHNTQKATEYICFGKVEYHFTQNTVQSQLTTCKMQVDYSIISFKTGNIIDSYSQLIIGNGFSKLTAKNNTLKKFSL